MSTALYRRYRPENFAEVIGQEHVTVPLMQALRSNRVNHAYLFSGPRGCGKTTSARILARILNCARNTPETPSDTPCGECESCVELSRGGPGSLDVVEIDAASHGGVDDARELRERATFSPSRDRFKIFILDEAHMVTAQGFNALLKIVEEPPEYLKFIFATTEPEKVIGTIRSRTHHYPFRLVSPTTLQEYLGSLCESENISVGAGVLPLVVRAGGGSVRDSLSVLDQLMAGAQDSALDYERAVSLLGYTHVTLLDDVVEALAARDGASMFRVVDHVIATGHEPRRFVEDLLERLRDLIVLSVSGDAAQAVLRNVPADQMARMQAQASNLGLSELSRSADTVNAALSEMSGATSPRLHLELLCARLLLPAVDDSTAGLGARLDRLERGAGNAAPVFAAPAPAHASPQAPAPASASPAPADPAPVRETPTPAPVQPERPANVAPDRGREASAGAPAAAPGGPPWDVSPMRESPAPAESAPAQRAEPAPPRPAESAPARPAVPSQAAPVAEPGQSSQPASPPVAPAAPVSHGTPTGGARSSGSAPAPSDAQSTNTEMLRRRWPEVLDTLSRLRKATWALVSQNAQVAELTDTTLVLTFSSAGLATAFRNSPGAELVQRAVRETLGFDVRVEGSLEDSARPAVRPGEATGSPTPRPGERPHIAGVDPAAAAASWDAPSTPVATVSRPVEGSATQPDRTSGRAAGARGGHGAPGSVPYPVDEDAPEPPDDYDSGPEHGSGETPRQAAERRAAESRQALDARSRIVDDPQPDDEDLASSGLVGVPLVTQMLGGRVIDEIIDGQ